MKSWIVNITICLLLFSAVLSPSFAFFTQQGGTPTKAAYLTFTAILALFFTILFLFLVRRITHQKSLVLRICIIIFSTYYLYIFYVSAYWVYTGHRFDRYLFSEAYHESFVTLLNLYGWVGVFLAVLLTVYCGSLYYRLLRKVTEKLYLHAQNRRSVLFTLSLCTLLIVTLNSIPSLHALTVQNTNTVTKIRDEKGAFFPDNNIYGTNSTDNVVVLQLESINAIALQGKAIVNGKKYKGNYMPQLRKIANNGIFIPFFLSTAIRTNRAQAAILCGITNNLGKAFSHRPKEILTDCLPHILKKNGYSTILYRADRLSFDNTGTFMKTIGMQEVHNYDIMQKGDPKYAWGYDDCIFYDRAFEHLNENHSKKSKIFAYFEVSTNHSNFDHKKPGYDFLKRFEDPKNLAENYFNSALIQDHCVSVFYDKYLKYAPENTHLFIFADTSYPIGIHGNVWNQRGADTENFLTSLVYIPPASQKEEFAIGSSAKEIRYSHNDLIPTIFSLLNNEEYQNSFQFALRKDDNRDYSQNYEDCQMLLQPYSGGFIAVVREGKKYTYSIFDKTLHMSYIEKDLLEKNKKLLEEGLSYNSFMKRFTCNRFQQKGFQLTTEELPAEYIPMDPEEIRQMIDAHYAELEQQSSQLNTDN